jgi:hypothetical protein
MNLNVYLCGEEWVPAGVCTVSGTGKAVEFDDEVYEGGGFAVFLPRMLNVYLDSAGTAFADVVNVLLESGGDIGEYMIYNPACSSSPVRSGLLSYHSDEEKVVFSFPSMKFSGLDRYVVRFSGRYVSYIQPSGAGEITSSVPRYVMDNYETIEVDYSETILAPGETVTVGFTVLGGTQEIYYRSAVFESQAFTGALITGCGLYTQGSFYKGGGGVPFDESYYGDEDLRWKVFFSGQEYVLRPSDFTPYELGTYVPVVKNGAEGNVMQDGNVSSGSLLEALNENDLLMPLLFYGGVS